MLLHVDFLYDPAAALRGSKPVFSFSGHWLTAKVYA
jgi:hypothetical protein